MQKRIGLKFLHVEKFFVLKCAAGNTLPVECPTVFTLKSVVLLGLRLFD